MKLLTETDAEYLASLRSKLLNHQEFLDNIRGSYQNHLEYCQDYACESAQLYAEIIENNETLHQELNEKYRKVKGGQVG